eukprot:XP_008179482.1 PREDICTED: probable serine/threonine-protein phosphatase PP2A regulatory subunit [Acyrthosiphon pisum]
MAERIEQATPETYRSDYPLVVNDGMNDRSFIEATMNCDRLVNRLESMNFLRDVALKLGPENTRKHLVPYLTHLIIAEKLSELKNLAEVLGEFEYFVGGPKYAHILLLPLEELAGAKLGGVRMAAIKSLQTLADIMEVIDLENYFIPLIASLTMNDKCTKRCSVSHLFTTVYMRVSPKHQSDLMDYHCFLSLDVLPSVRQNAANNLVDFSEVVHMSIFDSKLTPRLEQFSFDQNEHVRILALSIAITISKKFDVSYTKQMILPIVLNSINDPSCEVRSILIKNIAKLLEIGVSCLKLTENIMKVLISLTKDQQIEVRLQSVSVLYDCTVVLYENLTYTEATKLVTKFLIPTLCDLSHDSDVKCKLEVPAVLAKFGKIMPNVV